MADDIKILVDSSDVVKADQRIDKLEGSVQNLGNTSQKSSVSLERGIKAVNQFGKISAAGGKDLNRFNMVLQQGGFQLQDFIVQLQGGTSFFTAFSQQGSQFAGIFGPTGAVVGAIIALGSAVAGMAFATLGASNSVKTFEDQIKDTTSVLQEYFNLLKSNSDVFSDVFERNVESLRLTSEAAKDLLAIAKMDAFKGIQALNESLVKSVLNASYLKTEIEDAGRILNSSFGEIVAVGLGGRLGNELRGFYKALKELESAPTLEKQYEAALRIREIFKQNVDVSGKLTEEQVSFWKQLSLTIQQMELLGAAIKTNEGEVSNLADRFRPTMGQIKAETTFVTEETIELTKQLGGSVQEAMKLQKALDEGKISASQLRGIDLEKGITPAVKAAKELAEQLGISFRIAAALSGAIVRGDDAEALDPRSQRYDANAAYLAKTKELVESGDLYKPFPKAKTPRGGGGGKTEAEELADRIIRLEEQIELEQELLGKSEARRRVIQALGVEFTQQNAAAVATYEAQIEAIIEATRLEQERQSLMDSIQGTLESGFMSMIDGTKSVKDAFRDMAAEIIKELYRVLVVQQMVGSYDVKSGTGSGIVGAIGKILMPTPNANGNAFNYGRVTPFASGGVVGSPTYFPMAGGKTGLMGEAGPEAIMPLKRDKNGRLGVSVEGGSGSVVVNNNINVTGGSDPAAIRMEVAKLMPQIANATKTAVIDARRRGGQMKAAFG